MKALYFHDSYLREFEAKVESVSEGKYAILDATCFYPNSGGQPHDTGTLTRTSDGAAFRVVFVAKTAGGISHEVQSPEGKTLSPGDAVKGKIDWERRHKLMASHTAAHIISAIIHERTGALITGNQLDLDKCRIDFSLEDYDPSLMADIVKEAGRRAGTGAQVKVSFITRDEAEKVEGLSKLAKGLPPGITEVRIVDIEGIDRQADGGTHVRNTSEIGGIKFLRTENKGKNNRRLYFSVG
ncbi:MAG: alanyl-tRNA editing protein [Candidatus Aenigmatarchaeota archaeon]